MLEKKQNKILRLLKISFGNVIEWYDFCLYGYFADIIAKLFFPSTSHFYALLATFATFGIGFLARPLGGVLFGYLGDKIGRYYAMNLAILFMGIPTITMAILPDYNTIGIFAPILLVLVRIVQGLSAGGQYSNLLTITTEDKQYHHKGFNNGIAYSVTIIGFIFAAVISYLVTEFTPKAWADFVWRIPYGLSIVLLITQVLLREHDKKPSSDKNAIIIKKEKIKEKDLKDDKAPLIILLTEHKLSLFMITGLSIITSSFYYLVLTYLVTFTVDIEKLSMSDALQINTFALFLLCSAVPLFGLLSDYIGRKISLILAFVFFALACVPILSFLDHHSYSNVLFATLGLAILMAWVQGAATPFYTEIFPKNVRSSGCSISYGVGVALAGFAPMAATIFEKLSFHGLNYFFYLLVAFGVIIAIFIPGQEIERIRIKNLSRAKKLNINFAKLIQSN